MSHTEFVIVDAQTKAIKADARGMYCMFATYNQAFAYNRNTISKGKTEIIEIEKLDFKAAIK